MVHEKNYINHEKKDCCGCGACVNTCPRSAIMLQADTKGFLYPVVDESKCINCGLCNKVCKYQSGNQLYEPQTVYAASAKQHNICIESASGGIFAIIAKKVLEDDGIVFGAAMLKENGKLTIQHISIHGENELYKLQGSKYVQSNIGRVYSEAKEYLKKGKRVLFSGTPCQIAGLYGYLQKEYDNLTTVDIICHGVPSEKFFQDYIDSLMYKKNGEIETFKFRDKTKGWGLTAKYIYRDRSNCLKSRLIPFRCSSYYDMFIKCETYRENCYSCPYATSKRVGDITLGDFWGIKNRHPEWMESAGGIYSEDIGISCVIVNTNKGSTLIEQVAEYTYLRESSLENVAQENHQLVHPSKCPETRKKF